MIFSLKIHEKWGFKQKIYIFKIFRYLILYKFLITLPRRDVTHHSAHSYSQTIVYERAVAVWYYDIVPALLFPTAPPSMIKTIAIRLMIKIFRGGSLTKPPPDPGFDGGVAVFSAEMPSCHFINRRGGGGEGA